MIFGSGSNDCGSVSPASSASSGVSSLGSSWGAQQQQPGHVIAAGVQHYRRMQQQQQQQNLTEAEALLQLSNQVSCQLSLMNSKCR